MRIAAIGRTKALYDAILNARTKGHEIAIIVTDAAAPEYDVTVEDFRALADEIRCPFHDASVEKKPLAQVLESVDGLDLGLSVNWTSVVTDDAIALFQYGILNSHAGDLPKYRGNAPANWAILAGEKECVLSIHFMEGGKLDAGRVVAQSRFPLSETTRIGEVCDWFESETSELFGVALDELSRDPEFQLLYASEDEPDGFRCYPRTPDDSFISWESSALDIDRLVRASSSPFLGAYTYIIDNERLCRLYLLESRVVCQSSKDVGAPGRVLRNNTHTGETHVMCGEGILGISRCRIDDGPEFNPGNHFKSIRIKLGVRIEDYLWMKGL